MPAGKPFIKTTSESNPRPAETDQSGSSGVGESFRNIYKSKPFPKPDYRVPPTQEGMLRESVYPVSIDSVPSSTGYEILTVDGELTEDRGNEARVLILENDATFETRSVLPSLSSLSSSSVGDYETLIQALMPSSAPYAPSSETKSTILFKRPTATMTTATGNLFPISDAVFNSNYPTDETIDVVDERSGGDDVAGTRQTSYIVRHASSSLPSDRRRLSIPTLIQ